MSFVDQETKKIERKINKLKKLSLQAETLDRKVQLQREAKELLEKKRQLRLSYYD